jgi:hypothetical protein
LKEWGWVNIRYITLLFTYNCTDTILRPANHKELYNLQHVELQNVIECVIGVFKKQFKIVCEENYYPMEMQAKLIPALCALHNFICIYDPNNDMEITQEEIDEMLEGERPAAEGEVHGGISAEEVA